MTFVPESTEERNKTQINQWFWTETLGSVWVSPGLLKFLDTEKSYLGSKNYGVSLGQSQGQRCDWRQPGQNRHECLWSKVQDEVSWGYDVLSTGESNLCVLCRNGGRLHRLCWKRPQRWGSQMSVFKGEDSKIQRGQFICLQTASEEQSVILLATLKQYFFLLFNIYWIRWAARLLISQNSWKF